MTPSMTAGGRVGPTNVADGTTPALRMGKQGELITSRSMYEEATRGKIHVASIGAAGVAPGTALGTAPPLALYNAPSSGIYIEILQLWLGYISGTLGAGQIVHAFAAQTAAPTGGTELTPQAALLGASRSTSKAYTGSTIAATATLLRPAFNLGAGLASTAELPRAPAVDEVNGGIIVPSGYVWCAQGIAAAGSSPLVTLAVVYREVTQP